MIRWRTEESCLPYWGRRKGARATPARVNDPGDWLCQRLWEDDPGEVTGAAVTSGPRGLAHGNGMAVLGAPAYLPVAFVWPVGDVAPCGVPVWDVPVWAVA